MPLQNREEVTILGPDAELHGALSIPFDARALVLTSQCSGAIHANQRHRAIDERLAGARLAMLRFDLLSPTESTNYDLVLNVQLLASRLLLATEWVSQQALLRELPIGIFGANTGAGAALWAAAELGKRVSAIVLRGGRPDLAFARLRAVEAPTLLIVGSNDPSVVAANRRALARLDRGKLVVIPDASHRFEERGTLEEVGRLTLEWFERYLMHGHDLRFAA